MRLECGEGWICHFQKRAIWGRLECIREGKRQSNFGPVKFEMPSPSPLYHHNVNLEIKRTASLALLVELKCSIFRNVLLHGPNTNEEDMLLIQDRT